MRFSLVVLFAASLASAASIFKRNDDYELPWCAKDCVQWADPGHCQWDDAACLCVNTKYYTDVATCVQQKCSEEDAKKAAEYGIQYCKKAGVDPKNPLPQCGLDCIGKTPTDHCDPTDDKCLCENKNYLESVVWCFKDKCNQEDLKTSECVGEAYCRVVGVDISSIFGHY